VESNSLSTGGFFSGPHSFSLQLIALLFVKLPQPGDSKGIFSASTLSCHVLISDPKRIEEIPLPTLAQRNIISKRVSFSPHQWRRHGWCWGWQI